MMRTILLLLPSLLPAAAIQTVTASDNDPPVQVGPSGGAISVTFRGTSAAASPGLTGAHGFVQATNTGGQGTALGTASTEGFVTFYCTSACSATTVTASMNVLISGYVKAYYSDPNNVRIGGGRGYANLLLVLDTTQSTGTAEAFASFYGSDSITGIFPTSAGLGTHLFTFNNAMATSGAVTVPLNIPILVKLRLEAGAHTSGYIGQARGVGEAELTAQLRTFGDVFNLPNGFSAESTDFNIVDNQVQTPEPGTLLLSGIGLLALGLWRRRTR